MPNRVSPIRPENIVVEKGKIIPDKVIDIFNKLIAQNWNGRSAIVQQKSIVAALVEQGFDRGEIYSKQWLDVEDIFRAVGWTVAYDKPGYNESYEASFKFSYNSK